MRKTSLKVFILPNTRQQVRINLEVMLHVPKSRGILKLVFIKMVMLNFIHGQQTKSDNSEILSEVEELDEEDDFIIKSQR
ncbi:hypothetical protein pb186bvf_009136 [Paramecium bursaria]